MKNLLFLSLLVFCFCTSCKENDGANQQVLAIQKQLAATSLELDQLQKKLDDKENQTGKLVHVVYFDLKEDLEKDKVLAFTEAIQQLKKIKFLKDLEIGAMADSGDKRMLSEFEMMMSMTFKDLAELEQYQKHPVHLQLKERVGEFLAKPPRVYDYWIR